MKRFNVTGNCIPGKHYMVDISSKIEKIVKMVDDEQYFTINRARQYGKTTTLDLLTIALQECGYICASISFEELDEEDFATASDFCIEFVNMISEKIEDSVIDRTVLEKWQSNKPHKFSELSKGISSLCRDSKIVLIIDEVDKTSNNKVFLKFLSMLRSKYLKRNDMKNPTFYSVILAGVTDIKNLKLMMTAAGNYVPKAGEGKSNSPWNIAADFKIDMSFSPVDISTMLVQYEADHNTGMDITAIAEAIYSYTNGYPFLVSRICQHIHEELNHDWTLDGIQASVKIIIKEDNTLFDDMNKNMENNKDLYDLLYDVLIKGKPRTFSRGSLPVKLGLMYGIIKETEGGVAISNKIFESVICNKFIADDEIQNPNGQITGVLKEDIVTDGKFNMALCIEKFAQHYYTSFADRDLEFCERHGRLLFLAYLQPLINGRGFYHIESETRNTRRMDIVVDYNTDQFIIELKLWHGNSSHDKAYTQLLGYMDGKGAADGYLLTFDFRQDLNKERKAEWVEFGSRHIFDVII